MCVVWVGHVKECLVSSVLVFMYACMYFYHYIYLTLFYLHNVSDGTSWVLGCMFAGCANHPVVILIFGVEVWQPMLHPVAICILLP